MPTTGCPYCGVKLINIPKRKTTCPDCRQPIYIRKGKLVTEYEAQKTDWLVFVEQLGVTRKTIDHHREKLKDRFGENPRFNDICWSILNSLIPNFLRDYQKQKTIYLEMVGILGKEGRNSKELRKQVARMDLYFYKENSATHVTVNNSNDDQVCDKCRKLENKKISPDEALQTDPVPEICENHLCRCWYVAQY